MSGLSCRVSSGAYRVGLSARTALVCGLWMLVMAGTSVKAQAQALTTQMLIGDAVSADSLAQYTDVDQAIKYFINRDVLASRQFLEAAKKKYPALPPVDLLLAKMFFLGNNAVAGRAALEKTATETPDDPEPVILLADQALAQGRTIEADALYAKAFELTAKFNGAAKRKRNFEIRARAGRASVAQRRKNWDLAVDDLQALLKIDPENAVAHYRLGQTLFMQNKFEKGYAEFKDAKSKDKNIPDPDVATALMYDQLKIEGKAAKTQQFFERAMATNKSDPATITGYAQWLIKQGTPQTLPKAEALLAEARKANPGNLN